MRRLGDPSFNRLGIKTVPWGLGRSGGGYFRKVLATEPANLILYHIMGEAAGGVAIDSSSQGNDGAYTAVTLGQPGIGDGNTSPSFDGATSFNDIYSIPLTVDFDGGEGSLNIWARVSGAGIWTDGVARRIMALRWNGQNRIYVSRSAGNNDLDYRYEAGNVDEIAAVASGALLDWMTLGISWSATADEVRYYLNGIQQGATKTVLGVWVGTLAVNNTLIGASSTVPVNVWDGLLAHGALWTTPLTPAQFLDLATV